MALANTQLTKVRKLILKKADFELRTDAKTNVAFIFLLFREDLMLLVGLWLQEIEVQRRENERLEKLVVEETEINKYVWSHFLRSVMLRCLRSR